MDYPTLYRKRIIPDECILLKDDIVLSYENDILITKWNALKPKKDLHHGYSCYFFKEGYKISKFYKEDNSLLYYYCDIIDYDKNDADNSIVVTDLLADVIIYPDNFVKVVDLDELATALNDGGIQVEQIKKALLSLNNLLELIYAGQLPKLISCLKEFED